MHPDPYYRVDIIPFHKLAQMFDAAYPHISRYIGISNARIHAADQADGEPAVENKHTRLEITFSDPDDKDWFFKGFTNTTDFTDWLNSEPFGQHATDRTPVRTKNQFPKLFNEASPND